jgi:hypothetical protein
MTGLVEQSFYYDGKAVTLYNPGEKYYATVAAPERWKRCSTSRGPRSTSWRRRAI